jgi:hypothetical protein
MVFSEGSRSSASADAVKKEPGLIPEQQYKPFKKAARDAEVTSNKKAFVEVFDILCLN